ncbi:aldose epimerase family protein [Paraglaciecola aestuariivivens]
MITQTTFGTHPNGQIVRQFCLTNKNNVQLDILNLGGIIRRWQVPNQASQPTDIVLGFDSLEAYLTDDSYLGALVGRYANRIKHGKFNLGGQAFASPANLNHHSLHGGPQGFNSKIWQTSIISSHENPSIKLQLTSEDGDQGFPGNLTASVIYTLTEQNRLRIEYFAQSDKTTVYNPTNHSYFNLNGHKGESVASHQIQVPASYYTPTDEEAIPTGEIAKVQDTPFDFRKLTTVQQALNSTHPQIRYANGLDHNLCVDGFSPKQSAARFAGKAVSANGKIGLEVYTSMPGMQLFSANHFANKPGKEGALYQANQGLCFETQFYPDSPNQANFPSATLAPDQEFYALTEYQLLF